MQARPATPFESHLIWTEVTVRGLTVWVGTKPGEPTPNVPKRPEPKKLHKTTLSIINRFDNQGKRQREPFFWREVAPIIRSKYEIEEHASGYSIALEYWGIVDFYPKGGKLLIRKENTWISHGLKWLFQHMNIDL